jgi:energy-coupling factor transporter ATP-binding protein EcfA2
MIEKLDLKNLSVRYGSHVLLNNLCGSFSRGQINLVVGRAGSGKSTLLRVLAGFHKEYDGSIEADGAAFAPSGNISLAFQNPEALFFNGTVEDEVGYALKMRKMGRGEIEPIARAWLRKWGLDPEKCWHNHPLELSGGEKRRLAIAACTIFMPPVVLFDEPLAGLDAKGQHALAELLAGMTTEHVVIVVTHEPEILLEQSGSLLYLHSEGSRWLKPAEFLRHALIDRDFFPLPEWYRKAVGQFAQSSDLPPIRAEAVHRFFKSREGKHADQL